LTERVQQNIATLNVPSLYCYMFHSYQDFKNYYPQYKKEFVELRRNAVVEKVGVSIYTNEEMEDCLNYDIDLIQLPFNLMDNSNHRADVIHKAKKNGVEVHTRSVFLQGLFFKERKNIPSQLKSLEPYLNKIDHIASRHNLSTNDLALAYALRQNNIDYV